MKRFESFVAEEDRQKAERNRPPSRKWCVLGWMILAAILSFVYVARAQAPNRGQAIQLDEQTRARLDSAAKDQKNGELLVQLGQQAARMALLEFAARKGINLDDYDRKVVPDPETGQPQFFLMKKGGAATSTTTTTNWEAPTTTLKQ